LIAQADVWNLNSIALLLVFFVPGFITLWVYDFFTAAPRRDWSQSVLEVVAYSLLNYLALSWVSIFLNPGGLSLYSWISLIANSDAFYNTYGPVVYYAFFVLALFILPVVWVFVIIRLRASSYFHKYVNMAIPKPWDYMFGKRVPYWVILHLKDGSKIGGKFDKASDSFASSYPASEQIYLGEVWKLDENGKFVEKAQNGGLLIFGEQIYAVEFFE
jgi:hypothetical protein